MRRVPWFVIAVMLALTVVEPQSSGIGGGGFLIVDDGKGGIDTLDGREPQRPSQAPVRGKAASEMPLPAIQPTVEARCRSTIEIDGPRMYGRSASACSQMPSMVSMSRRASAPAAALRSSAGTRSLVWRSQRDMDSTSDTLAHTSHFSASPRAGPGAG